MKTHPNAKINLGLNIIRRRPDGFHDIETVFIPLTGEFGYKGDLYDTLEITPRTDGQVTLRVIGTEQDWETEKDLCVRAYRELEKSYRMTGADIRLTKRIPTGAGLGGGSSDAAFTMKMLNSIFSLGISDSTLAEHAANIGSDTSFFIYNRPMLATGRGEILSSIPDPLPEGCTIALVTPEIHISTAEAYSGVVPRQPERPLTELLALGAPQWKGHVGNDFEESLFAKHPALAAIKDSLYEAGAVYASMSGSGSALYGIF